MSEVMNGKPPQDAVYRVNIKLTAKGEAYFDVTTRGDTIEETEDRLNRILALAANKCSDLNRGKRINNGGTQG